MQGGISAHSSPKMHIDSVNVRGGFVTTSTGVVLEIYALTDSDGAQVQNAEDAAFAFVPFTDEEVYIVDLSSWQMYALH